MTLIWCKLISPVDIFGIIVGGGPYYLLLSGTVVGENPDHVCWVGNIVDKNTWQKGQSKKYAKTEKELEN